MGKIYVCIKELDYGIEDEIIKPGGRFKFIRRDNNRYIIQGNGRVLEIYDWALKEYFEEVV